MEARYGLIDVFLFNFLATKYNKEVRIKIIEIITIISSNNVKINTIKPIEKINK